MKKSASSDIPKLSVNSSHAYRLFYPQVPLIVASRYGKLVAAMPANSCMPISDDPPLFAVSVRRGLKTNRILRKSKRFSVNWLGFADRSVITLLSESSNSSDKLRSFKIGYREVLGAPVLERAQAYAICERTLIERAGDHDLILGQVLGAMASLDFDEYWKFESYKPILYLGSDYRNPFTTILRASKA